MTKKKVKKIATKQIKELAPELSVASAETADTATTANSASTAARAGTAASVNGLSVVKIHAQQALNAPNATILNLAGLRLTMNCIGADRPRLTARTTKQNSSLYGGGFDTVGKNPHDFNVLDREGGEFDTNTSVDLNAALADNLTPAVAHLEYEARDRSVASVDLSYDFSGAGSECVATGTAIGG